MEESHSSRGAAFGDFDNDGDVAILVMNMNEPPSLLRNAVDNNVNGAGNWIKVLLEGTKSNRSAIGARVIASYGDRKQAQAVTAQSSYLSVNDRRLHFGLGRETKASLQVFWPCGDVEAVEPIESNRLVVIREGHGVVRTSTFPGRSQHETH